MSTIKNSVEQIADTLPPLNGRPKLSEFTPNPLGEAVDAERIRRGGGNLSEIAESIAVSAAPTEILPSAIAKPEDERRALLEQANEKEGERDAAMRRWRQFQAEEEEVRVLEREIANDEYNLQRAHGDLKGYPVDIAARHRLQSQSPPGWLVNRAHSALIAREIIAVLPDAIAASKRELAKRRAALDAMRSEFE